MAEIDTNATTVAEQVEAKVDQVVEATEEVVEKVVEKKHVEVIVPPKPEEDPVGYMQHLGKNATKKVSYQVLDWVHKTAGNEGEVPGAKKQQVSQKEFMGALKDGTLLAQLANKMSPGTVETVHEAPKEADKQKENLNGFLGFLKDKAGVTEETLPTAEDVQQGTSKGYQSLLTGLVQLATKAFQMFQQQGISPEKLQEIATQVLGDSFVQRIMQRLPAQFRNLFQRNSSAQQQIADSAQSAPQQAEATPDKTPLADSEKQLANKELDDIPAADASA